MLRMASAFPRAAEYLAGLPEGPRSFPECVTRAETYAGVREQLARIALPAELPPESAAFVRGELEGWLPEVAALVPYLMVCDRMGEDAFLRWAHEDAARLFQRPLMRHLMRLVSPTLLVLGAASRWKTLRRGTDLRVEPVLKREGRATTTACVVHPEGLYPEIFARGITVAFSAAIEGAHGKDVAVELLAREPGRIVHRLAWRA